MIFSSKIDKTGNLHVDILEDGGHLVHTETYLPEVKSIQNSSL